VHKTRLQMPNLIDAPTFTDSVNQQFIIEPLKGPLPVSQYTDRFPDALYHKAPESHLVRFLQAVLGPAGLGWLRKNTLEARLIFEAQGLELVDLDAFYGDPFGFGRIFEEVWNEDPSGLLPREVWTSIRTKDESYRSRALDFMNGARAGNTPFGLKLVARSGLGHEVEIIENYRYIFDIHSDDPVGIPHYGKTNSINEFIVLPRQEVPRSEEQQVAITGEPTSGEFVLFFNGRNTIPIPYDATLFDIQSALQDIQEIGPNGVEVVGTNPIFTVRFRDHLAKIDVAQLTAQVAFGGGVNPDVKITTITNGLPPVDEVVHIPERSKHGLQTALDRIRPVPTLPTIGEATGLKQRQHWSAAFASSEYNEVLRYVTGNPKINFPPVDRINWIERNKEKEAPRVAKDLQYHYVGFHSIASIEASSEHVGRFSPSQTKIPAFAYLRDSKDDTLVYSADRITADYFEPLTVTTITDDSQLINGIYPASYLESPQVPPIKYAEEQFWASREVVVGSETVTLDLGSVQAVNFIAFEICRKPIDIGIQIDVLDQADSQEFESVKITGVDSSAITYSSENENPWFLAEFALEDRLGLIPLSRYVRLNFIRREGSADYFANGGPWSIDVRNLRIGRSVSDY
jgi:hypothetical protein